MTGLLSSSGSEFQTVGPAIENARRPYVFRRQRGTMSWCRFAERRRSREATSEDVMRWSARYRGAWPWRQRYTMTSDFLWHIQPMKLIVQEWHQTAIKLPCVADHTGGSIEHSLQLVSDRLRSPCDCVDCVAIVDARRNKQCRSYDHTIEHKYIIKQFT